MMKIIIEIQPAWGGCRKVVHEVRVANVGMMGNVAAYEVERRSAEKLGDREPLIEERTTIRNYNRDLGAFELARRVLNELVPMRVTDKAPKERKKR